jgi:hypothetical protein
LQEELDAYDRINKESEEFAERRRMRIIRLEKAIRDHGLPMPQGDEDIMSEEEEEEG